MTGEEILLDIIKNEDNLYLCTKDDRPNGRSEGNIIFLKEGENGKTFNLIWQNGCSVGADVLKDKRLTWIRIEIDRDLFEQYYLGMEE